MLCSDTNVVQDPAFFKALPPCVRTHMPSFVSWATQVRQRLDYGAGVSRNTASAAVAGGSNTGKLVLLLLALVAASAAAAVAVLRGRGHQAACAWRLAWLRRPQHRSTTAAEEEGLELLQPKSNSLPGGQMRHRRSLQLPELVPGRARLKALAQHQLGPMALLSGRPEAELLHILNGAAHSFAAAAAAGSLLPAASVNLGPSEQLTSTAAGGGATTVQLVRRWGLPTESLRMAAADLQVRRHASCKQPATA